MQSIDSMVIISYSHLFYRETNTCNSTAGGESKTLMVVHAGSTCGKEYRGDCVFPDLRSEGERGGTWISPQEGCGGSRQIRGAIEVKLMLHVTTVCIHA